ncbi:hypothetical protein [Moorena producens]
MRYKFFFTLLPISSSEAPCSLFPVPCFLFPKTQKFVPHEER